MLGMTYCKEEGMSLSLSYWTTNRSFLNIFNCTIIRLSLPFQFNHWLVETSRLTPPFLIISLPHTEAFFLLYVFFFFLGGSGVGAMYELKPKKNRVGDVGPD